MFDWVLNTPPAFRVGFVQIQPFKGVLQKAVVNKFLKFTKRYLYQSLLPTNTPRGFYVETTWKRSFPRSLNVELMWCVCRLFSKVAGLESASPLIKKFKKIFFAGHLLFSSLHK